MPSIGATILAESLDRMIAAQGFAFVGGSRMRAVLEQAGPLRDWPAFAASWDDLAVDRYMADGGRYRRRRHAIFAADAAETERQPHGPHFQARDYNPLHGGIERWFEPVSEAVAAGDSLRTILRAGRTLFGGLAPQVRRWHIEVHQFRIEARQGEAGQPTPEGMHRDGVDYVLVLMVRRHNIRSGTTSIHDLQGRELGSFTLSAPFDAALVEDARVFHGVTPVEPIVAQQPAFRDVLVVTYRRRD